MRLGKNILSAGALSLSGLLVVTGCQADTQDEQSSAEDTNAEVDSDGADSPAVPPGAAAATPRPGVAAAVAPEELAEEEAADAVVVPVVTEQYRALEDPEEVDWDAVVAVADGSLLSSIEVVVLEYAELGWTQVGTPELVASTVLEYDEDGTPPTALVEICLDHAAVDVIDSEGASLVNEAAESRVKSILTMDYVDDRWVATAQDFTDELSC